MTSWFEAPARTNPLQTYGLIVVFGLVGCSGSASPAQVTGAGGTQGDSGSPTSGPTAANSVGGATSAGPSAGTGGPGIGGSVSTGGMAATTGADQSAVGGVTTSGTLPATGGTGTGGAAATGGTPTTTGSTATAGDASTGTTTGDAGSGGAATGGATTGGSTTGGSTTGDVGSGGATTGGATTGGSTTGGTVDACATPGTPLSGGTQYCSNGLGDLGNGYQYEVWMDSGSNCGTMYGVDAAFRADWNLGGGGDFIARAGLSLGSDRTFQQIGTISADYSFTKTGDGFSWMAVYGWTFDPLVEYYIVEDWTKFRPATDYTHEGTITVDGGTYDIYRNRRVNAVSPVGTTDFDQFWSVRQEARQCGHISITDHFSKWESLGMAMGNMREAMLLVEALDGSGTKDFTYATVQVN